MGLNHSKVTKQSECLKEDKSKRKMLGPFSSSWQQREESESSPWSLEDLSASTFLSQGNVKRHHGGRFWASELLLGVVM